MTTERSRMRHRLTQPIYAGLLAMSIACLAHATPEKAAGFYGDALRKYDRNDFRGAVIQLKNAIQQDKTMLAAHVLLGRALLRSGDLKGADEALEIALSHGLDRSSIALPLAQIYLGLGRPDLVIDRVSAEGLPKNAQVEILSLRGTAYGELGKPDLAMQSFRAAQAVDPSSAIPLVTEVSFLLASSQYERAKTVAAKAIAIAPNSDLAWNTHAAVLHATSDLSGALDAYDRALSIEPRHIDARTARASLLIDLKRDRAAEKDLDFLRQTAPGEPRGAYMRAIIASRKGDEAAVISALNEVTRLIDTLSPAWLATREQLLMLGALANHGLGNLEKARGYLNHILVRNTRNIGAKKLFASICIDLKDYPRALAELELLYKVAPEDPQVLFMLGSVHLAQHRYSEATQLLEKAALRNPLPDVNRALGLSQLELGRTELGLATLEKVLAADPADGQAGTTLALLYMRRGQPQKAMQVAEALLKHSPGNLTALNFLGRIKMEAGDRAGARAAYTQATLRDPNFKPAAINLARLDAEEGRYDDARRRLTTLLARQHDALDLLMELSALEQRAGKPTDAVRHLRRAVDMSPRDARAGIALVELYLVQHQLEPALAAASELAFAHANNVMAQLSLAAVHVARGDLGKARAIYQSATRLASTDPAMQVGIARLQIATGNPEGAHESVQAALRGRPDDLAAMVLMVEVERQRGGAARAEAALKRLTVKHPEAVETALAAGDLALALRRYPAAITAYRAAAARQESTANALKLIRAHLAAGEGAKALAFLSAWTKRRPNDLEAIKALAETEFRTGQLSEARRNYERVLAASPNDAPTLNNYANLLHRLNDPAAQKHAERALTLAPYHPQYADTLGWILTQKGGIGPALGHLREARLRNPGSGEIRYHLAFALAKAARTAEAREELAAALVAVQPVERSPDVLRLKKQLEL